jgi:uncharacterized phage protein (TIGR02218 family)
MKDVTTDYIDSEHRHKRKPVELYHIWTGAGDQLNINVWYYTSGDVQVIFNNHTYLPATLKRSLVQYDASNEVTKMTLQAAYVEDPALEFVSINPIEIIWIEAIRLHRDQVPLEADVIFVGQIKNVSFKGTTASAECVGFEHFLSATIPQYRYQLTCNWKLFEPKCTLIKDAVDEDDDPIFRVGPIAVAVDDLTGTILTSAAFSGFDDGYFVFGTVEFGDDARTIVDHIGSVITINFKIKTLTDGDLIKAYPGCDGRITTCKNKFDNLLNFLGFPFIPEENPTLRNF